MQYLVQNATAVGAGVDIKRIFDYRYPHEPLTILAWGTWEASDNVDIEVSADGVNWVPSGVSFTDNGMATIDALVPHMRANVTVAGATTDLTVVVL